MAVGIRGSAVAAAIAVVASLGLMLTGTASVAAGSQQARLSVSPATGPAGSQAKVQGSGFSQGQAVKILWADTGKVLATATGTAFAATVTIPGDAAEGSHTITARDDPKADASGGRRAVASFTVSAASQEGSDDAATDGDDASSEDDESPDFSSGTPEDDEPSSNRTGLSPDGDSPDGAADGGSDDVEDASSDDEPDQGGASGEAEPSPDETRDKAADEGQAAADDDGNASSKAAYRKSSGGSPTTVAGQSTGLRPTAIEGRPDTEQPPAIDWSATPDADAFEIQDPEVAGPVTPDSAGNRRTTRPQALARSATRGGSDDVVAQSSPQRQFLAAQRLVALGLFNQNGAVTGSSTQGTPAVVTAPLTAPNSQELSLVLLAVSGAVIIWHRRRLMTPAPAGRRSSTLPSPDAHRG